MFRIGQPLCRPKGDTGRRAPPANPPALASSTVWSPSLPTSGLSLETGGSGDPSLSIFSNRSSLGYVRVSPCRVSWYGRFVSSRSDNGEEIGWIGSLHGGSDEGGGSIYGVCNFLGATLWRIRFLDGVIEAGMVPSSWNNFLRPLLCFVVVRSNHNERLVRISLSPR